MLAKRLLTAALGIPLVAGAWWAGPTGLLVLALVIGLVAAWELGLLLARAGLADVRVPAVVLVLAAQGAAWVAAPEHAAAAGAAALAGTWLVLTVVHILAARAADDSAPARLLRIGAAGLLAAFWVAWPLSLWPALYRLGSGGGRHTALALAALPLAVTWLCDTAAYFAGLCWGRLRLAPALSPRKSVEGAVAGLAAGAAAGALLSVWLPWPAAAGAAAGTGIAAAAQLGDLWESAVKRASGVKDSGCLLPGHGGVLDRFDALLLALPAAYLVGTILLR
ncbi:MAG TPA: phosphatidate cytidylyltransferase [Bacillota bacterium]